MYDLKSKSVNVKPTHILGGAIAIYEGVYDNSSEIVRYIEDNSSSINFLPAQTHDDLLKKDKNAQSHRTNYGFNLKKEAASDITIRQLSEDFSNMLSKYSKSYSKTFNIYENIIDVENHNLIRYEAGQKYDAHYDGATHSRRALSAIFYINDDYIGGEIEFINFDITIKPKAGSLVLFPSNYAYKHKAYPVLSGTKYAIVTWLHDC